MKLKIHVFQLELKHTFSIAHESRKVMPSLVVELQKDGMSGFGEATETRYYGITMERMVEQLQSLKPIVEKTPLHSPEQFWQAMYEHLSDAPFLLCALDQAAHDLYGKLNNQTVYEYWGLKLENLPTSNFTIGIASIEEMVAKMQEQPWPIYKVKLGTDHDIEIIEALREHTEAAFRVDANTAWSAEQTVAFAPRLKSLGVEFLEQPLKADNWEGMKSVMAKSVLPVIADESCHSAQDIARCYGFFHGVNIKLMKCGGLTPAKRMIEHARKLGLQVMVGCMTESSVGISAIAQLLPLLDYVDMDGALLLSNDPATGVALSDGKVHFPDVKGTGAGLK
jgi:L-alanine-DL-glutamate epimerase-like enolase superfamily enzyme